MFLWIHYSFDFGYSSAIEFLYQNYTHTHAVPPRVTVHNKTVHNKTKQNYPHTHTHSTINKITLAHTVLMLKLFH